MNINQDNQAIIEEIRANLAGILSDLAHAKAACDRIINYCSPRVSVAPIVKDEHPDVHMVPVVSHNEEEQSSSDKDNNIAKEFVYYVVPVPDNIVGSLAFTEICSMKVLAERVQFLTMAEWVEAKIHSGWGKTASISIGVSPNYLGRLADDKSPGLIMLTIARKSVEYFLMCSVVSLLQPIYVMHHVPANSLLYLANNLGYRWSEISPYYVIYVWIFDPGITHILLCVSTNCLLAGKIHEVLTLVSKSISIMSFATNQVLLGIVTPFFLGIERNYQFPIKGLLLKMEVINHTSQQVLGTDDWYTRLGLKLVIAIPRRLVAAHSLILECSLIAVLETTVYTLFDAAVHLLLWCSNVATHIVHDTKLVAADHWLLYDKPYFAVNDKFKKILDFKEGPDSKVYRYVRFQNGKRHFTFEIMGVGYVYTVYKSFVKYYVFSSISRNQWISEFDIYHHLHILDGITTVHGVLESVVISAHVLCVTHNGQVGSGNFVLAMEFAAKNDFVAKLEVSIARVFFSADRTNDMTQLFQLPGDSGLTTTIVNSNLSSFLLEGSGRYFVCFEDQLSTTRVIRQLQNLRFMDMVVYQFQSFFLVLVAED